MLPLTIIGCFLSAFFSLEKSPKGVEIKDLVNGYPSTTRTRGA